MKLLIIGGAEDKTADKLILRFLSKNLKKNPRVVICTTATDYPEEVGKEYVEALSSLGISHIRTINISSRYEAHDADNYKRFRDADCIFFTGGDQLRISSILGGTPIHEVMLESKGQIIAGTSAGASMMSDIMIVEGKGGNAPVKCSINLAAGLGLLKGVIIDQHFNQRGRIGRLLSAIAENPSSLGIGIDENTAIFVNNKGIATVFGTGVTTILDGRFIEHTNISCLTAEEPLALTNVKLHVLPAGYKFDLNKRVMVETTAKLKEHETV